MHSQPEKGPVTAEFKSFKVLEANVDLAKLDTAKAVIQVDTASIVTGEEKRDTHVKSPDFLDAVKFPSFTLTVDRLKAVEGTPDAYEATATVDLRGVKKEVPVRFEVVEKKADGAIVIEGEAKGLARGDWAVGGESDAVGVADGFEAEVRLTLSHVAPAE
jgi:polyisoprenoid-binding protein YceI